jgi:predicted ester cyclase
MMTPNEMSDRYRGYINCLNSQAWDCLGEFVDENVEYNGKRISISGYRDMLEGDFRAMPDLRFNIDVLCSEPPMLASRLQFDCTPIGMLFGIPVNGKRIKFSENVFYEFHEQRIIRVLSIIDKAEIARQVART